MILGTTGQACCACLHRHVYTKDGCVPCDDDCTGLLLDDIEFLIKLIEESKLTNITDLPWIRLKHFTDRFAKLRINVNEYQALAQYGLQILGNFTIFDLETLADILYLKSRNLNTRGPLVAADANRIKDEAQQLLDDINELYAEIMRIIKELRRFGFDPMGPDALGPIERLLMEVCIP